MWDTTEDSQWKLASCHMLPIMVMACWIVNSRLAQAVTVCMQCDLTSMSKFIIITSIYRKNY